MYLKLVESVLKQEKDKIKGGKSDNMTIEQLYKFWKEKGWNGTFTDIKGQLMKGMKVEKEHTKDDNIAREIAMDHLREDPMYYDKLEYIEKQNVENELANNSNPIAVDTARGNNRKISITPSVSI